MALQTMIDKLNEAKKKYDAQLKEVADQGIAEIGKHLAANLPPGWALWWTQYTPHFNDGEACHFSVRDVYLVPEDKLDDVRRSSHAEECGMSIRHAIETFGQEDVQQSYKQDDRSKPLNQAAREGRSIYKNGSYEYPKYEQTDVFYTVASFRPPEGYELVRLEMLQAAWDDLSEDLLERTFGDHARCVVKSDGTASSSDHDHD